MKAYRWNGEYWYEDEGMLRRAVKWFVWFGGWEAHRPSKRSFGRAWTLRERLSRSLLCPVCFFRRLTIYSWGWTLSVPSRGGSLTKSGSGLYWSPDGTPSSATIWFRGAPPEVLHAARESAAEKRRILAALADPQPQGKDIT